MTDIADQIRRLHGVGVDNEPVEFAKGGIIPPGSDLHLPSRCLYDEARDGALVSAGTKPTAALAEALKRLGSVSAEAGGSMPQPSADDAVRVTVSPAEHISDPDRAEALGLTADAKRMRGYGDVSFMVEYRPSGRVVTVTHADDAIGVSTELLHLGELTISDDGNLVADTAGEYVYRPVRFAEQGRVVVCERVR